MKSYLPYFFRKIGIVFVLVAFVLSFTANLDDITRGFAEGYNGTQNPDTGRTIHVPDADIISSELSVRLIWISLALSLCGLLMYMFSREKVEDEFIRKLRYMSLSRSLLYSWLFAAVFMVVNKKTEFGGIYILQLQLILYVVIYNYYKKWKFA